MVRVTTLSVQSRPLIARAIQWFVLGALSVLLGAVATRAWTTVEQSWGTVVAASLTLFVLVVASVVAAALFGHIALPGASAIYPMAYTWQMLPWWLRLACSPRQRPWQGTAQAFLGGNAGRQKGDQSDFGVGWCSREDRRGHRVTWIHETGEAVIVRSQDGATELVTTIDSEFEVTRRLDGYGYAMVMPDSLKWARRRLRGFHVPLTPGARAYQQMIEAARTAWPSPPPPSVGRKSGSYFFSAAGDDWTVEVSDAVGRRPLYHHVDSSPTGFSWGYGGSGPTDLARSLLADRLGYVPRRSVYFAFRDDVVARLPREDVSMEFTTVDEWIDANGALFAADPRAEPFDPFAAGGQ